MNVKKVLLVSLGIFVFFIIIPIYLSVNINRESVNEQISQGIINKQDSSSKFSNSQNCKPVDFPEEFRRITGSPEDHVSVNDIAISNEGEIFLLEYSGIYDEPRDNYISVITKEGKYMPKWSNPDFFIHAIKLNNKGELYLFGNKNAFNNNDLIYKTDSSGTPTLFHSFDNELISFSSNSILFDQNNNLYTSDNAFANEDEYDGALYNDIKVINKEGELILDYKKVGMMVGDMKFDNLGNLYTLNHGNTNKGFVSISKITPNKEIIKEWVRTDRGTNLVIDEDNNIYTAFANAVDEYEGERNKIYKISPEGSIKKADLDLPGKQSKSDVVTYLFIGSNNVLYAYGGPLVGLYEIDKDDLSIKGLIWKPQKGNYGDIYPFIMHNKTYFFIFEIEIGRSETNYKLVECSSNS